MHIPPFNRSPRHSSLGLGLLSVALLGLGLTAACGSSGDIDSGASGASAGAGGSGATAGSGAAAGSGATAGSGAAAGSGAGGSGATAGSGAGGSGATAGSGAGGSGAGGSGATGGASAGGSGGVATGGSGGSGGATAVLRFVAIGDTGEGNTRQYKVSQAIENECASRGGCDFSLLLGDNFYDVGVSGVSDPQFQTKFEQPYANLNFPFYVTLGNHDYGAGGTGLDLSKDRYYIDYTAHSTKWYMPARHYKVSHPGVDLFSIDSNRIFLAGDVGQLNWLRTEAQNSTATWKFAFGHHPYISNGKHGNAGTYEGIPFIPIVSGGNVKSFVEEGICGRIDVYFAGHDHNMQWLQPKCGTEFIVSGAGAKMTSLEGRGTQTYFETDEVGGFLLIEVQGRQLSGWFYDEDGNELFSRSITK